MATRGQNGVFHTYFHSRGSPLGHELEFQFDTESSTFLLIQLIQKPERPYLGPVCAAVKLLTGPKDGRIPLYSGAAAAKHMKKPNFLFAILEGK